MTRVIGFCAGPSAGKTTCAMGLASLMKRDRKDVLYVPEFAMELCSLDRERELDDQLYLLGEQAHRLYMAKDKYEYVVTDSPLFMQVAYVGKNMKKYTRPATSFDDPSTKILITELIMGVWREYDNVTFYVDRKHRTFKHLGRIQDEDESKELDKIVSVLLQVHDIPYATVSSAQEAYEYLIANEDYSPVS